MTTYPGSSFFLEESRILGLKEQIRSSSSSFFILASAEILSLSIILSIPHWYRNVADIGMLAFEMLGLDFSGVFFGGKFSKFPINFFIFVGKTLAEATLLRDDRLARSLPGFAEPKTSAVAVSFVTLLIFLQSVLNSSIPPFLQLVAPCFLAEFCKE